MTKKQTDKIIIYRLIGDATYIIAFAVLGLLLAENLLPGLISSGISFLKIFAILLLLIILLSVLGRKLDLRFQFQKLSQKVILFFVVYLFIILALSDYKFSLFSNLIITSLSTIIILRLIPSFLEVVKND